MSVRDIRRLLTVLVPLVLTARAEAAELAGWIELATLEPVGIVLKAKLDTGAKTTSINATDIEHLVVQGKRHVRFTVENKKGERAELLRPVVREVAIREHSGPPQRRPVVILDICVGGISKEMEVNLVNRQAFNYHLLIGRNYLAGDFVIDSAKTYHLTGSCGRQAQ